MIRNGGHEKPFIDLRGPDGNAMVLIGTARRLGKQIGMEREDITALTERMMSGDYENLVTIFDEEFGSVVDLIR